MFVPSKGCDRQYTSIRLDDGLAPNRRQAIIWSNNGIADWYKYASLDLNE